MALPPALPLLFPEWSINRGAMLHRSGAVEDIARSANGLRCMVRDGSRQYTLIIALDSTRIATSCDCNGHSRCAHLWAAFLEADARGLLGSSTRTKSPRPSHHWRERLSGLRRHAETHETSWPIGREIVYIVDHAATLEGRGLMVQIAQRERKRGGDWTRPKPRKISREALGEVPDPVDRQILWILCGPRHPDNWGYYGHEERGDLANEFRLVHEHQQVLLPLMCSTGRAFFRPQTEHSEPDQELWPLAWDGGEPWRFWLEVRPTEDGHEFRMRGALRRDGEQKALSEPVLLTAGGLVFCDHHVARLDDADVFEWIAMLRKDESFTIGREDGNALVAELLSHPHLPPLDLPEELGYEEVRETPRPLIKISAPERDPFASAYQRLHADLFFEYDGFSVGARDRTRGVFQADARRFLLRDPAFETAAAARLRALGFRPPPRGSDAGHLFDLAPRHLPAAVRALVCQGWKVEATGKLYRPARALRFKVRSGIDWFDLSGTAEFDDVEVPLPTLLRALRRGEKMVELGDGTFGILPEDWLNKYSLLAGAGEMEDGQLRFRQHQVGLLDALLASQPEADVDQPFAQARERLCGFETIAPAEAPPAFTGTLRPYQREGLGWLHFLREFGFGGCLADDMGLGKTVQVLALLEARRSAVADGQRRPSLVVAPRSLIFNWKQEAERFTPRLKLLDHTGPDRPREAPGLDGYDLVLTTYGTLRRDVALLQEVLFDYAILDESQAIKNAETESAKAARLLRAQHRLALSGTPIENHIGELWSLFEFLNPGLLGRAQAFESKAREGDAESHALLARSLRPYFLRRTKEQVVQDLPPKVEQTVYCDLEGEQRALYDELREHYRALLLPRIEKDGLAKSKIQILEALLRLRQAACHPGLIDRARVEAMSAKLEALLAMLTEVREGGHKALVFSQFVSFLSIVRHQLDQAGLTYEYLDGQTRDRGTRVRRFQEDPACGLFLISLKAGGLGLNLTAADYVFLLDPWWNPAVEAQAIDRTHRIGQVRHVFAYRLIARDTVEEKVLALQASKRRLADAILGEDASLIRTIRRQDLELLLS